MDTRYATRVFGAAGVMNCSVGAATYLAPAVTAGLMGIAVPQNLLFVNLSAWLVFVLGVGYCLTALNPGRNRDLMLVGAVGKLLVLPLMLAAWRRGDLALAGIGGGVVDFVFALLFFDVMRRTPVPTAARSGN